MAKVSIRSCTICRKKFPKADLLRLAVNRVDKTVVFDSNTQRQGTVQSRGCYCCRDAGCLKQLEVKKAQVFRALRVDGSFSFAQGVSGKQD